MDADRWNQIDEIFQSFLEQPPERRAAYLDEVCSGDESLRKEIEAYISYDEQTWSLLDSPAFEVAAPILSQTRAILDKGQQIAHYEVLDLIGAGGMGEVYLAQDTILGRKVALKLLPENFTRSDLLVERFRQEARTVSSLNHPNILTIHEIAQDANHHFIATEFIEGETLRRRMQRGRLSLNEALDIAVQAAGALATAHNAGIIHRDIKPENVMLRTDGYVKVLDFGLAKLAEQEVPEKAEENGDAATEHSSGLLMGTLRYMSPEQAKREPVDARSDIFSLGVVLYEMLAGQPPFTGETPDDVLTAIVNLDPLPVSHFCSDLPRELQPVISKALSKEKAARYQTIQEMLADLKRVQHPQVSQEDDNPERMITAAPGKVAPSGRWSGKTISRQKLLALAPLIVVLGAVVWLAKDKVFGPAKAPLPFQERDWVLIGNVENRTGDPLFDRTVEYAIERELSNSRFVNVVPAERVGDALRLMKKPPDTTIDAATGKEVCLRDGGIRALLTGRAEKLGSTTVLSVNLIEPHQGNTVASHSEEAASQEQVANAIRQLANWVRQNLGEALSSIKQNNQELEKVTTPSLRALQLYTQGNAMLMGDSTDTVRSNIGVQPLAEQLFRQAVIEDSEFASAFIMLAWTLKNQGKPEEEWKQASERALELSDRVSERERYFITGSYHTLRDQLDKAIPVYETLLQQYPDDYWGLNNLGDIYTRLQRYNEAHPILQKAAELRPNNFQSQIGIAELANRLFQMEEAFHYAHRASSLITPEVTRKFPYSVSWVQYYLIVEPWIKGDYETHLKELDRLAQTVDARGGRERDAYANFAVYGYLRHGKLQTAQEFCEKMSPGDNRDYCLALVAFLRDNAAALKNYLLSDQKNSRAKGIINRVPFLLSAGLLTEARKIMAKLKGADQGVTDIYRGEVLQRQGHIEQSITPLQAGINELKEKGDRLFLIAGYESLSQAFEQQNDVKNQLRVLEEACNTTVNAGFGVYIWQKLKLRLAKLYRKLGRIEDAEKQEADLLKQLAYADSDHPILRQLKQPK